MLLLHRNDLSLVVMSVHLSSKLDFRVFRRYPISLPIVFAATCSRCTVGTFGMGDVSCLLGPVRRDSLRTTLYGFRHGDTLHSTTPRCQRLRLNCLTTGGGGHFLIRINSAFHCMRAPSITFFCDRSGLACLRLFSKGQCVVDCSLSRLRKVLSESIFFEISEDYVSGVESVQGDSECFNDHLGLCFRPRYPRRMLIDHDHITSFLG